MDKLIPFCVWPEVKHYSPWMVKCNMDVDKVLEVAMVDFLMVSSIFKKFSEAMDEPLIAMESKNISISVKELQYMDAFSQKLNHIMDLNKMLEERSREPGHKTDHAGFIFKLNYLQAVVARNDFRFTVTDLKKNLHELHDHIIEVTKLDFNEKAYFKHFDEVMEGMDWLIANLKEMMEKRLKESPLDPAVKQEVVAVSDFYSMDSERYVLVWLSNHPEGDEEEIIKLYEGDGFNRVEEEIELF